MSLGRSAAVRFRLSYRSGMGIFRRKRRSIAVDHTPVLPGDCACPEHIDSLLNEVVAFAPAMEMDDEDDMTVRDLIECQSLGVDPAVDVWMNLFDEDGLGERVGPFHWRLWVGDEARCMYDDDAPLQLNEALLAQPGVELVEWEDREILHVGAPTLCADGMLAATARALMEPRVKG